MKQRIVQVTIALQLSSATPRTGVRQRCLRDYSANSESNLQPFPTLEGARFDRCRRNHLGVDPDTPGDGLFLRYRYAENAFFIWRMSSASAA